MQVVSITRELPAIGFEKAINGDISGWPLGLHFGFLVKCLAVSKFSKYHLATAGEALRMEL